MRVPGALFLGTFRSVDESALSEGYIQGLKTVKWGVGSRKTDPNAGMSLIRVRA